MRSTRRATAVAVAMLMFSLAEALPSQQPFQVPTSIGSANGLQDPIEVRGTRMLLRRNVVGGDEIGIIDGVTSTIFVRTMDAATSAQVPDPRLERTTALSPQTVFFTFPIGGGIRQVRRLPVTGGVPFVVGNLGAGDWRLEAINAANDTFFFRETTGAGSRIARLGPTGFLVLLTTPFSVQRMSLSPNGQNLAVETSSGSPFTPSSMFTVGAFGATLNPLITNGTLVRSRLRWLDDDFVACIALQGTTNQVVRVRRTAPNVLSALTQAPVNVEFSSDLAVSDDRQWMTFVTSQTIGVSPNVGTERCVVAMRLANAGSNDPGGAMIALGDYRSGFNPPPATLTSWNLIGKPQIQSFTLGTQPIVRVVWSGRRQFTDPIDFFRCEVTDEVQISPRAVAGSTVQVTTQSGPLSLVWGVFASLERTSAPVPIPGILNSALILNPVGMFSTVTNPSSGVSVPLPISTTLVNARVFFQSIWVDNQNQLFTSGVSELPIF